MGNLADLFREEALPDLSIAKNNTSLDQMMVIPGPDQTKQGLKQGESQKSDSAPPNSRQINLNEKFETNYSGLETLESQAPIVESLERTAQNDTSVTFKQPKHENQTIDETVKILEMLDQRPRLDLDNTVNLN